MKIKDKILNALKETTENTNNFHQMSEFEKKLGKIEKELNEEIKRSEFKQIKRFAERLINLQTSFFAVQNNDLKLLIKVTKEYSEQNFTKEEVKELLFDLFITTSQPNDRFYKEYIDFDDWFNKNVK